MANGSDNLRMDRFGEKRGEWKVGVWSNYGIDGTGQSNYCACEMSFLAWAVKKPTYKEIREAFPSLDHCMVLSRKGYKKVKNSDIVIEREDGLHWKMM